MNDENKNQIYLQIRDAKFYVDYHVPNPIAICSYLAFNRLEKLQAENAKLRDCVEFYAQSWEREELDGELLVREIGSYNHFVEVHSIAQKVLKELEK